MLKFKQIFNELCYEIGEHIADPYFRPLKKSDKVYIILLDNIINADSIGEYRPSVFGSEIHIHRYDRNCPNISYTMDIATLLHEFGHHKNVVIFKYKESESKTGFIYGIDNKYQIKNLLKEELHAWINAFKCIWYIKNIKSLTFFYKLLLSILLTQAAIDSLTTYVKFAFLTKYKTNEEKEI